MRTRPLVHAPLAPSPAQLGEILSLVFARTGADFRGQRGQEPYSLAMLLAGSGGPWTVRATDVDPAALAAARAGAFAERDAAEVPVDVAARHLVPLGEGRVAVAPRLAAGVRFDVHDVSSARGLPAGPFDLVLCRNVLIYFVRDVQAEVLARLLARLRPGGFLCLGEAEWPAERFARELEIVDRPARIFQSAAYPGRRGGATA